VDEKFYRTAMSDWSQRAAGEEAQLTLSNGSRASITLRDYY
jgi:hypothetical protein